ncbi:Ferric reductase domain protein transmembrane component domain [Parvibaculum lavamentivorans DS-1]|uniref:Ferric reductase domain protein transmembrane component domain n=1 Tax=Parvibaculum lavamentivorans (strain DS-1 / DSM 13023 / NCIMB 13966) TaxID=402881 RepID=A7HP83_PARL1|nr:ferredoxin reductase family protein [Parvibaculum lavamentivorans]ABS61716.1 Ferric reductase domain protein transmembrane component domain [Parvibaculum lavamentivorans DS-1]
MKPWQIVLTITAVSFGLTMIEIPAGTWLSTAALSLACGVAALSLMAAAAILAGRWGWPETALGGLDRVYAAHKWLAVYALALASVHFLFKAGDPSWAAESIMALPQGWTRLARQASFVALMSIVILALNRNIPYSTWRWWHRLSGPLFLIVIVHWLSIKSPLDLVSPAGLWLAGLSALGIAAAAYKLLLYPFLARHADYRVVKVLRGPSAAEIEFEPVKRGIDFHAGHFGFLRMKVDGLREPHPFTIAAAPAPDGRITFVIRALGDYTAKLIADVEPGMEADVYAPYGRFERKPDCRREIWIGGGVGISPFIAWMRDEQKGGFANVSLFYFFTPGRVFPDIDVLRKMAEERGIEFVPVSGGPGSRDFIDRFGEIVRDTAPGTPDIALCGPAGLLESVRGLARENGLDPACIRHELFQFR